MSLPGAPIPVRRDARVDGVEGSSREGCQKPPLHEGLSWHDQAPSPRACVAMWGRMDPTDHAGERPEPSVRA